jgi:hypothetical protein
MPRHTIGGLAFFVLVALIWLVPDRRLERAMAGLPPLMTEAIRTQSRTSKMKRTLLIGICVLSLEAPAATTLWSSSSKDFGASRSDFVLREVERRPRSSLLQLEIKDVGGSVGSSMIIACMLARLAEERGGYRYLVKVDSLPGNPNRMLVGFSHKPNEQPQSIDAELPPSAVAVDLEIFGPEFNKSCRTRPTHSNSP